jgi:hypothetical protein
MLLALDSLCVALRARLWSVHTFSTYMVRHKGGVLLLGILSIFYNTDSAAWKLIISEASSNPS